MTSSGKNSVLQMLLWRSIFELTLGSGLSLYKDKAHQVRDEESFRGILIGILFSAVDNLENVIGTEDRFKESLRSRGLRPVRLLDLEDKIEGKLTGIYGDLTSLQVMVGLSSSKVFLLGENDEGEGCLMYNYQLEYSSLRTFMKDFPSSW